MGIDLKTAFLLTAGIGSRLAPHTEKKPKPSLPFLGLPLLNYGFYLTQKSNFNNYLFNRHHLPNEIALSVKNLEIPPNSFSFLDETKDLLGSGGAIWNARNALKEHDYFLIANGDEVLIPKNHSVLDDLVNHFLKTKPLCTLLTCDHPELLKKLKPVWVDQTNNLLGFGKDPITDKALPQHYTGYKVFSTRIFDLLPKGNSHIFYDVFVNAIKNGNAINTYKVNLCHWYETGNFKGFKSASITCLKEHLPYFNEVHKFYGNEMELVQKEDNLLYKPKNLTLPSDLNWNGIVTIGNNVQIGSKVSLHNCFIDADTTLDNNSIISEQFLFAD